MISSLYKTGTKKSGQKKLEPSNLELNQNALDY